MSDSSNNSQASEETGLRVVSDPSLALLSKGAAPALEEMVSRSLVHIEASKISLIRHRIGEHELCDPDYRLVCIWAEELQLPLEKVLELLLAEPKRSSGILELKTTIQSGKFKNLLVDRELLGVSGMPFIKGLSIEVLSFLKGEHIRDLNFLMLPHLTKVICLGIQLLELNLSDLPKLTELNCEGNQLTKLDLSNVPNLIELYCGGNQLTELDLSGVPNLTKLNCSGNQLTELDLSHIPNLTQLDCIWGPLTVLDLSCVPNLTQLYLGGHSLNELDIRPLLNLKRLKCYCKNIRLIQRPDQNF